MSEGKPDWKTCPHETVVKRVKSTRSGGGFNTWRCTKCNLEFKPTMNKG